MKVAIVCPYALDHMGGVQSHARQLTAELLARGVDAWLVGPGREPSKATEFQVGGGFRVSANGSRVPIALSPLVGRRLLARAEEADVVHVHEPWIPIAGWAAQLTAKPTILTFHADPANLIRRAYGHSAWLLARLANRSKAVTVVSRTAASAIAPFAPHPVIIPNGVEVNPMAGRARRSQSAVFVGRDEDRKGLKVLLRAWPQVRAKFPNARLTVLTSRTQPMMEGVEVLVGADDPTKLERLASSAVFVAPNLGGESFGITVAEAMAAGCAVVASDIPAFADLLGGAGRLVVPGDSVGLAATLSGLFEDEDRLANMAASSSE
ncbi:MAG TPA: glycosyltransferase family 1 protein, partial [Actinobacteria bacterium]|nr:glycosyltransferase family 1 protein [Actinomycetota bacterium]